MLDTLTIEDILSVSNVSPAGWHELITTTARNRMSKIHDKYGVYVNAERLAKLVLKEFLDKLISSKSKDITIEKKFDIICKIFERKELLLAEEEKALIKEYGK